MQGGEEGAAGFALGEFLKGAMSMISLLNRRYAPYYKWMFRGLSGLERVKAARPLLGELSRLGSQEEAWRKPYPAGFNPYVNIRDRKVELIEEICALTAEELRRQGLTDSRDDFLEAHTWEIMKRIRDPEIRGRHVLEG